MPNIVVGFRDDAGHVRELKTYETKTVHRLVRAPKNNGLGYWEPMVCFNFGKGVLEWCLQNMQAQPPGERMVMRYDPAQAAVTLRPDVGAASGGAAEDAPSAKRPRV